MYKTLIFYIVVTALSNASVHNLTLANVSVKFVDGPYWTYNFKMAPCKFEKSLIKVDMSMMASYKLGKLPTPS